MVFDETVEQRLFYSPSGLAELDGPNLIHWPLWNRTTTESSTARSSC